MRHKAWTFSGGEWDRVNRRNMQDLRSGAVARLIDEMTVENADATVAEVAARVPRYIDAPDQAATDLARARARHAELTGHPAPTS